MLSLGAPGNRNIAVSDVSGHVPLAPVAVREAAAIGTLMCDFQGPRMVDNPIIFLRLTPCQPYYCGVGAPDTSAGGGQSRSSKYLRFGHSMTETFECDLRSLLGEEVFFYDPYIVDEVIAPGKCFTALVSSSRREKERYV